MPLTLDVNRTNDGYKDKDDAEFLADVACFDCGEGKDEARECEDCGVVSCCVSRFDCAGGYEPDGLLLCPDCTPSHGGCPECDPADPRDH